MKNDGRNLVMAILDAVREQYGRWDGDYLRIRNQVYRHLFN